MSRLQSLLLLILMASALLVVAAQHQSRKLFIDLQTEQDSERKLDQEWRELQIESQTLGAGKRIEQKAVQQSGMVLPDPKKTIIIVLDPPGSVETKGGAR